MAVHYLEPNAPIGPTPFPADDPPEALYRFRITGILLELPRRLLTPALWQALSLGRYGVEQLAGLMGVVRPGDVVLELGAGFGIVSAFVSRALQPGHVVAVEADPEKARAARRTHTLNGAEAALREGLVAAGDGIGTLYRPPGAATALANWVPGAEAVRVPSIGFAGLLRELRPQVLVANIGGAECALFDGVDLTGLRAVSLMLHREQTGLPGIRRLFQALGSAGFAYEPTWSRGAVVVFGRA